MKKRLIPFAALGLLSVIATSCGSGKTWAWDTAIEDKELGYIILVGEDGNPEAEDRTKGCVEALNEIAKEGGFTAKELERKTCIDTNGNSWNDQAAKEFVELCVTKYGDQLDFIVSNNDGMAIAAAGVTSLAKGTPIIGFDALSAACDMIKEGTLAGSVSQNGDDQALLTAVVLGNLLKGETNYTKVTTGYNGKAELNLESAEDHILQTKFAAVTKANADSLKPGSYVDVKEDSALKGKKMLVATYSNNDNFIKETYRAALPHYAEALGFEVEVIEGDGTNDKDLVERLQTKVSEFKPDCVALNVITHSNYESYLSAVGDIPTVFFNRQPKNSDNKGVADLSELDKVYFVGSGSTGQGTAQGQIIKDWYHALEK